VGRTFWTRTSAYILAILAVFVLILLKYRLEAAMWKAQKQAVSNILVPPPNLDLPTDPNNLTLQSKPV
jgi:hypothetical protein